MNLFLNLKQKIKTSLKIIDHSQCLLGYYNYLLHTWKIRKQPPRPIAEISVRRGVPSWKLPICSLILEKGFLENSYLFGSYRGAPGKLVSVR